MGRSWFARAGLLWGALTVLLVIGAGSVLGAARPAIVLKFATVGMQTTFYAPIIFAIKKGYFAQEGLSLEEPRLSDPDLVRAVAAGAVPFGIPEAGAAITATERGAAVVVVAGITDRYPYDLMVKPEYRTIADLKGKTLSIWSTAPGVALTLMKRVLAQGGLREGDYNIVAGGNSSVRYAALVAGRIDGTIITTPHNTLAKKAGFRSLAQLHSIPALFAALIANRNWVQRNEEVMVAWLRAAVRGYRYVTAERNRAEVITVLAEEFKADREVIEADYQQIYRDETYIVSHDLIPSYRSIQGVIEILKEINLVPMDATPAKYFDLRYINRAVREVGR